jgi:hypothetical protein
MSDVGDNAEGEGTESFDENEATAHESKPWMAVWLAVTLIANMILVLVHAPVVAYVAPNLALLFAAVVGGTLRWPQDGRRSPIAADGWSAGDGHGNGVRS